MLEVLENERVGIGMFNELSPIKVEEEESIHILMPFRLVGPQPKPEPKSGSEIEPESEPDSGYESQHEAEQQPESEFVQEVTE
jgi:hypothetical protein